MLGTTTSLPVALLGARYSVPMLAVSGGEDFLWALLATKEGAA